MPGLVRDPLLLLPLVRAVHLTAILAINASSSAAASGLSKRAWAMSSDQRPWYLQIL